jgi:hypothetical protein
MELELGWMPGPGGLAVMIVLLADAIETAFLPRSEAEEIARSTLEQWRSSGWEHAQTDASPRFLPVLVSTFGLVQSALWPWSWSRP